MKSPSSSDITPLISLLNYLHPLSEPIVDYLHKHTAPLSCRKGKLLLEAGSVCEHVYFIIQGAVRGFIRDGTRDVTTWISSENELVTSIYSLDTQVPALENIEAIEDCQLIVMSNTDLQHLYVIHPEFNIVGRKLIQRYYRDAESRAFIIRISKAEDKYDHFLLNYSHLANRVLLKHIASFLGVTFETLSRVRGKISSRRSSTIAV